MLLKVMWGVAVFIHMFVAFVCISSGAFTNAQYSFFLSYFYY